MTPERIAEAVRSGAGFMFGDYVFPDLILFVTAGPFGDPFFCRATKECAAGGTGSIAKNQVAKHVNPKQKSKIRPMP